MSPIVRSQKPEIRMTTRAIPLLALVTALCCACNGRSSETKVSAGAAAATHEQSSGAERGLPELETYASRLDDPSRDAWQKPEEVVALLECRLGDTVVDLGVGTGYFVRYLSRAVGDEGRLLALDIEPTALDLVRARAEEEGLPNVEVQVVAPNDPGLAPRSADRVLVANTWHHIEGRVAYAKKLLAGLRRKGRLLIVDFTMESPIGPPADKRLTVDTVVRELEAAGFEAEILEETLPHQYVVEGRTR